MHPALHYGLIAVSRGRRAVRRARVRIAPLAGDLTQIGTLGFDAAKRLSGTSSADPAELSVSVVS